jgi:hypothetical protein
MGYPTEFMDFLYAMAKLPQGSFEDDYLTPKEDSIAQVNVIGGRPQPSSYAGVRHYAFA